MAPSKSNPRLPPESGFDSRPPGHRRIALWLATGLGLGWVPKIPGTAGSLLGVGLYAGLDSSLSPAWLPLAFLGVLTGLLLLALWSTSRSLPCWPTPDPGPVVVDEVVGQFLSFWPLLWIGPAGWKSLLLGFILFRSFDVLKPFPIRRLERLPGAMGVVADDLLAGIYAGFCLWLLGGSGWLR